MSDFAETDSTACSSPSLARSPERRQEREQDDARVHLEIAARKFVEQGFDGVSINDVARAAGIGKATLYQHFASKTELFVECLERLRLSIVTPEERAVVDSGLAMAEEARLRATIVLARFGSFRMMTNLLMSRPTVRARAVAERAKRALHQMVTNAESMLRQAMSTGQMRKLDSELLAYMLWGALIAIGDRMALDQKFSFDEAVTRISTS